MRQKPTETQVSTRLISYADWPGMQYGIEELTAKMFEITVNDNFTTASGRTHFDVRAAEEYGVKFVTDIQGLLDLRKAIDATLSDLTDSERQRE